ncbi:MULTISPECIES: hypothetical protein [unclassified Arcicella]|uniref:hypothetical protein n=1 Tax=unclassified Arcicella TaxID=2644986 RepID=UPI002860AE29|nr:MULTISPECIES: hypothetical protein [unclassified Arcicella]MDR6564469.1 hypothetical protein [Arcicella sp. BE51]MDR6814328.1 hypothetical protein [Arcicella sp. BE140]MDR6825650.1 hypothetical protein [Arcicella sp. BE139]
MKKTKIERFIRDNRENFDQFEIPVGLWDKIDKGLGNLDAFPGETPFVEKKKIIVFKQKYWALAAGLAILIGCYFIHDLGFKSENTDKIIATVSPEYGDKMVKYASLIETKREEIRQIEAHDPVLYKEFATEIEKLNKDYQNLKAELPQTPNQEELVQAMIQNLQVQLDILNRQLSIIQKIKDYQNNPMKSI